MVPILGRGWDFLLFGPGATLLVSGAFLVLIGLGQAPAVMVAAAMLTLLLVGPHYAATYRRAYTSREIIRAHPLVTLAAPAALALGAVAAVAWPARFGLFYFLGYVAWAGYHYSGQSLGLAMLYPLRQGARLSAREKRLLAFPLHVSWLVSLLGLFSWQGAARNPAYEIVRASFGRAPLPPGVIVGALGVLVASFATVVVVARARRRRGVPLPAASIGVLVAQAIWFGWGLFFPLFNVVLVPIFHSLQYLALTSWHHQRRGDGGARRFAGYLLGVATIGLIINPGLLRLAIPAGATPTQALVASAAAISFINLHHFLLDGRIWRLREQPVVQSMLA